MDEFTTLNVTLFGRFSIRNPEGVDITPRGKKAQALLAILLTSKEGERSRVWIQDKLWSDRDQEHGAASLRQSLSEIRKSLGSHRNVLDANRQYVSLDLKRFSILSDPGRLDGEFLEGLDIRDPEFEDWLSVKRVENPQVVAKTKRGPASSVRARGAPTVVMRTESDDQGPLSLAEVMFSDLVSKSLREFASVEAFRDFPPHSQRKILLVSVQAFQQSNGCLGLRVSVEDHANQQQIWSEICTSDSLDIPIVEDVKFLGLSNRLLGTLVERVLSFQFTSDERIDANYLSSLAVRKIFSMRREELTEADHLLCQAYDIDRRGLFQAWRAQLFAIQFVEQCAEDMEALAEMADECCAYALEFEPRNSFVLAAVANARRVLAKNFAQSGELAKMAVRANPANPLAWWSVSAAKLYAGETEAAHACAITAQSLAEGSSFKFWADFQRSLTAAVTRRFGEAIRLAETSHALAPHFRPPLRYLTAIYAVSGQTASAKYSALKLMKLEGDNAIERMALDPDYPNSLMHRTGILNKSQILDLDLS